MYQLHNNLPEVQAVQLAQDMVSHLEHGAHQHLKLAQDQQELDQDLQENGHQCSIHQAMIINSMLEIQ
jgi:hypothetical protein